VTNTLKLTGIAGARRVAWKKTSANAVASVIRTSQRRPVRLWKPLSDATSATRGSYQAGTNMSTSSTTALIATIHSPLRSRDGANRIGGRPYVES
jgi:hypothetical protein